MSSISSGGSRISHRGVDLLGASNYDTLFGDNVCENARIGSCRGTCTGARPLDPPMIRRNEA